MQQAGEYRVSQPSYTPNQGVQATATASARASLCAATAHTVFPINRERIRRISLRSAASPEPKGRRDKRMAEKREAQRRRRQRRPARPAW
jgi:hypothetical protein